jgi:DNA-nicking Smr family endonuclease
MEKRHIRQFHTIWAEDAALFRRTVGQVSRLADQGRIYQGSAEPKSYKNLSPQTDTRPPCFSDSPAENVPDEYLANGVPRTTLRKLRRGDCPPEDKLDLHGCNANLSYERLLAFIQRATGKRLRCVLVIHGKGLNSPGGKAVLRGLTRHWLTQQRCVLGFCDAPLGKGGAGATLVLLKANT